MDNLANRTNRAPAKATMTTTVAASHPHAAVVDTVNCKLSLTSAVLPAPMQATSLAPGT
jgi:hypothetical protein